MRVRTIACNRYRRGAAWWDLVVVLGIILLLVGITIPMMLQARERSNRARCADNLRQIGWAMSSYAQANEGQFPCTRPTYGPLVRPDVSNGGVAATQPFDSNGPGPNNVPSILFLLLRTQDLPAYRMVCPNTPARPDSFAGLSAAKRSNFSSLSNLSYSVQNPYADDSAMASGFRWASDLPPGFAIAADKNPGRASGLNLDASSPHQQIKKANSTNHEGKGQNVLYADGRVEFHDTPFAGLDGDDIYTSQSHQVLASPSNATDSILLPVQ